MINRLAELDTSIQTIAKAKKPKAKSSVIPLRKEKPLKPLVKPVKRKAVAKALAAYQYDVPGIVPMVAQDKTMACWATVVTMLTSWRDKLSMSVEETMRQLGPRWLKIYKDNTGLFPSQEQSLFNDVGLAAEAPQSLSVDGWLSLLKTYGPLWVTTDERPGKPGGFHARVITGLHGDGTAKGTWFNIIDPAGGRKYKETIADFLPKYEAEIRETGRTRFQVIHWAQPTKPSQQSTSQSLSMRRNKWPTRSAAQSFQLALIVNYTVPGIVPALAQPTSMGCWATVFTMLLSWKRDQSISIENALATIGDKWVNMYKANTGISSSSKSDFISEAGLVAEPFHNPSIEGWENMLRNFGPIWVTTDEAPNKPWGIHARIITAINGDGTPDGTSFTIIDPAGGRQYQESITKFLPKYEAEIIERGEEFNRVQIIHWPKDAKYGKAKSFGRISSEQSYVPSAMSSSYQAVRDYSVYAFATQSFDVRYEVPLIPQQTGMSCWAAGAAMLVGWRDKISIDPSEIAAASGYWAQYKNGLHPEDTTIFPVWGMATEPAQTYTVEGFKQLLETHGPLWVASAEPGPHIRVVTGISGDGTAEGTMLYINDPWKKGMAKFSLPNPGSQYTESYAEFVRKQSTLGYREQAYANAIYVAYLKDPWKNRSSQSTTQSVFSAVFETDSDDAIANEWNAHTNIHHHFNGSTNAEKFTLYKKLRPLYQAKNIQNPAEYLANNIITVSFFGHKTPANKVLKDPLEAAEATLKKQGITPAISNFWGFVPRQQRGNNSLSNHALGRAIDINHQDNPFVRNKNDIEVIKALTGVDLSTQQKEDVMRAASQKFKDTFNDDWVATQSSDLKNIIQARRTNLNKYAQSGFLNLESSLINALIGAGFKWGGNWGRVKDFMHFEIT